MTVIVLASLCISLLIHHGCVHSSDPPDSNARVESCAWACYFQPLDIAHFEAWIFVCLTCGLSLVLCSLHLVGVALCAFGVFLTLVYTSCFYEGDFLHNISNHETWILVCFTNAALLSTLKLLDSP